MEEFAGFKMPIVYRGQSIKSEHLHTRDLASVFDVSHMMQVTLHGSDRIQFIESLTVADVKYLPIDRCTLSVFCNQQGGIIDDCIISRRTDHLHIVSNAGNSDVVWSWLESNLKGSQDVQLRRLDDVGLVALQGPKASSVLADKFKLDTRDLMFMSTRDVELDGIGRCQVTRCGYTGEDGFELSLNAQAAPSLVEALCADDRVRPAGLGSRDTLRLEAGLCLHGNDITTETTPVEAGLSWTIHKNRRSSANFVGSQVVLAQLKEGPKIRRTGLLASLPGGPPARKGTLVEDLDGGEQIGHVTSGTFGPSVGRNIAMAYLDSESLTRQSGEKKVNCIIRGKAFEYKIVGLPFVSPNYYTKVR